MWIRAGIHRRNKVNFSLYYLDSSKQREYLAAVMADGSGEEERRRTVRRSRRLAQKRVDRRRRGQRRSSIAETMGVDPKKAKGRNMAEAKAWQDAEAAARAIDRNSTKKPRRNNKERKHKHKKRQHSPIRVCRSSVDMRAKVALER